MPLALPLIVVALLSAGAAAAQPALQPCRLQGVEREVQCGRIEVAENPDAPTGRRIAIHYAVVPALARNKAADPLFVLAGGPGQAASRIAGPLQQVFAQINARRDIVYVDQRGTGQSNPLTCARPQPAMSLQESVDSRRAIERLAACVGTLAADTRYYATWIAMRDLDAVRAALGATRINLWGASYGTRAALEYLRQFPQHVRSLVLDGVAPADMVLPASFAVDADAALQRLLDACAADAACRNRFPDLHQRIATLLERGAGTVTVAHPLSGQREVVTLDRAALAGLLRAPLYAPPLAAVLPQALASAAAGDYAPLLALSSSLSNAVEDNLAEAMHFAVICAEDLPRLDAAAIEAARRTRFGSEFIAQYQAACARVPTLPAPAAFYQSPSAAVPVLVLSGGADPATPPRHAEAVVKSLPNARHLVAPHLGHGVTMQGCAPDLITRFVRAAGFSDIDGACLTRLPAPRFFHLPQP